MTTPIEPSDDVLGGDPADTPSSPAAEPAAPACADAAEAAERADADADADADAAEPGGQEPAAAPVQDGTDPDGAGPAGPAGEASSEADGSGDAQEGKDAAEGTPAAGCPVHDRRAEAFAGFLGDGSGPAPMLLDGDAQLDPHRFYREMRRDHGSVAPVVLDGDIPAWLVIGYRELHHVASDPVLFSRDSDLWNQWDRIPGTWPHLPMIGRKQPSILYTVGERHRQRSEMVGKGIEAVDPYTVKKIAEEICDELVDDFCAVGATDIIGSYAMLLPVRVLARMFGFPDEESAALAEALNDMIDGQERALAGQRHLFESMTRLVAERREEPAADAATRMLEDESGFSDEEIVQDLMVMLAAGHQPTADWIGNTLRLMLTDDRFAASLSGGRHSIAEAMTEVLWEDTPSQNIAGRWATRDTRLGNRDIRQGDMLILGFAGANYDPQVRTDASALTGGNNAFLSFSHGEHGCPVPARETAEIIARTAIEVLLDRLPDIDLDVPEEELTRRPSPWLRGLTDLPVAFTPTPPFGPAD